MKIDVTVRCHIIHQKELKGLRGCGSAGRVLAPACVKPWVLLKPGVVCTREVEARSEWTLSKASSICRMSERSLLTYQKTLVKQSFLCWLRLNKVKDSYTLLSFFHGPEVLLWGKVKLQKSIGWRSFRIFFVCCLQCFLSDRITLDSMRKGERGVCCPHLWVYSALWAEVS